MSPLSGPRVSKTQQRKEANQRFAKALWDQGKDKKQAGQELICRQLPFQFNNNPRVHVCVSKFGPKSEPRTRPDKAEKGQRKTWSALESRTLEDVLHNGSIAFAAIPNPNYVLGTDTPRWAAFRIPKCVPPDLQAVMERHVHRLEEVCVDESMC
jgi:hypothetical protein